MKTAVVTGGSSGIGREICLLLAAEGFRVFELSRHGGEISGVAHINCDVSDAESVRAACDFVKSDSKQIDLLVNNAGMGISGALEETEPKNAEAQMRVNFFGCYLVTKAFLPVIGSGGMIINVSSVAAVIPIPFQSMYSASKAAVNAITQALREEVRPFGIRVCAVMPGDAQTGFTDARIKGVSGRYERTEQSVSSMERDEKSGMPARYVAGKIVGVAKKRNPRLFYIIGGKYRLLAFLTRLLPASLTSYIVGKMY